MASTMTLPDLDIVIGTKMLAGLTALKTDIEALQTGTSVAHATVAAGASLILVAATHNRNTVLLNHATATTVTLPAATGSGTWFRFVVTLVPSGSHIVKVANANDTIIGILVTENVSGNAATGWAAGATADTITLNHTTTGAVTVGESFEMLDIAANVWWVSGELSQSGSVATPFSATV